MWSNIPFAIAGIGHYCYATFMSNKVVLHPGEVRVIGAGLAGCEAALQMAHRGYNVTLYEMKKKKRTAAQNSDHLAELVCSNSFRSNNPNNAVGLIKEEMRQANGFLISLADKTKIPAGEALAVDREIFSLSVEETIKTHPRIRFVEQEVTEIPVDDVATIVATGPLTSETLASDLMAKVGEKRLDFYDAIAPIVDKESIDMEHAFFQSRWGEEGATGDYLNCPLDQETYQAFVKALQQVKPIEAHGCEGVHYFEGCLPIEVMAERGEETLRFGPFRPVGLFDPKNNKRPHAVLQLRKEDRYGTSYNLVGCQTRMSIPEQKATFAMIPALRRASFLRFGSVHRNTYLDSPNLLDASFRLKNATELGNIFFAGQITGVEGYVESMACGFFVAHLLHDVLQQRSVRPFPKETALGGLYRHVLGEHRAFPKAKYVPSNVTWAMIPPLSDGFQQKISKGDKKALLSARALKELHRHLREI